MLLPRSLKLKGRGIVVGKFYKILYRKFFINLLDSLVKRGVIVDRQDIPVSSHDIAMLDEKLLEYIEKELNNGHTLNEIRAALINSGWHPEKIDNHIKHFSKNKNKFSFLKIINYLCYIAAILFVLYLYFNFSYCKANAPAYSSMGGSPVIDKNNIEKGYVLLAHYSRFKELNNSGVVYLSDMLGKPVHTWKTEYQPLYTMLKKNGNIVVSLIIPGSDKDFPGGGRSGILQELDWNGNVVWQYQNNLLHHDFEVLPNGNIAALLWERVPKGISKNIKGGIPQTEFQGDVWSDNIIEIDQHGDIVWSWHAYEHLDFNDDTLGEITPRSQWTHANSIRYLEKNPFDQKEAFLVSFRFLDKVILINKNNSNVIWKSPNTIFSHQHDATLLLNGNILVFDNNMPARQNPAFFSGSRVVEINPKTNKIEWEFKAGETGGERASLNAAVTSGAQRLSNGNTLIIDGPKGHLFQINSDKKLVWDFISPFGTYSTGPWPNNFLFKSRLYKKDEINWPEKIGEPLPKLALYCK